MTKHSISENMPRFLQCDKSISKLQTTPVTGTLLTPEKRTDTSHSALTCSETTQSCRNTTSPRLLHQRTDEAQQNSQRESFQGPTTTTQQYHTEHLKHASQSKMSPWLKTVAKSSNEDMQITSTIHLCTGEDLHHAQ